MKNQEYIRFFALPNHGGITEKEIHLFFLSDISIYFFLSWKYNIRRNINSDFSIVTMRRLAIILIELRVVKS